jgi:hypothetical protein
VPARWHAYDRYSPGHREQHERKAHLVLNGLANGGRVLTATSNDQEERS